MKACLLALLCVVGVYSAAQTCSSPLLSARAFTQLGLKPPVLRKTPTVLKSTIFCAGDYSQSCCSPATLRSLKSSYEVFGEQLQTKLESILKDCTNQCDLLDSQNLGVEADRNALLESLAEAAEECQNAALDHSRHMLCMSCRNDFRALIGADHKITVNEEDVAVVRASCQNFYDLHHQFNELISTTTGVAPATQVVSKKVTCKLQAIKLLPGGNKSIELCLRNKDLAFRQYIRGVAGELLEEWEFEPTYTIKYINSTVSVCDTDGCESKAISLQAKKIFQTLVKKAYKLKPLVPSEIQTDPILRAIGHGPIFDINAFFNEKLTKTGEIITVVAATEPAKPVVNKIRAANSTAKTNTSSETNTSATANEDAETAELLKTKLANATITVEAAMGSFAASLKALLVPFAVIFSLYLF